MNGSGDMTLAFELSALQRVDDPGEVVAAARDWTRYIGVVSEQPTYVVTNYTRRHRIRQDFFSGPRGVEESLEAVKGQFDTERHVFIGTDEEHARIAEAVGWEYLPLEEAAEAAGWALGPEEEDADGEPGGAEDGSDHHASRDDWP